MTPEEENKIRQQAQLSKGKQPETRDENSDIAKLFQNKDGHGLADQSGGTRHSAQGDQGTERISAPQEQAESVRTSRTTTEWSQYASSQKNTRLSETAVKEKIDENMETSVERGEGQENGEQSMDEEGAIRHKIDEQNDQLQAERRQEAEQFEEESESQITTVIASQRIMNKTGWAAAIGGGTVGIGGLAYFLSGSDSTAFIHVIRHFIA